MKTLTYQANPNRQYDKPFSQKFVFHGTNVNEFPMWLLEATLGIHTQEQIDTLQTVQKELGDEIVAVWHSNGKIYFGSVLECDEFEQSEKLANEQMELTKQMETITEIIATSQHELVVEGLNTSDTLRIFCPQTRQKVMNITIKHFTEMGNMEYIDTFNATRITKTKEIFAIDMAKAQKDYQALNAKQEMEEQRFGYGDYIQKQRLDNQIEYLMSLSGRDKSVMSDIDLSGYGKACAELLYQMGWVFKRDNDVNDGRGWWVKQGDVEFSRRRGDSKAMMPYAITTWRLYSNQA